MSTFDVTVHFQVQIEGDAVDAFRTVDVLLDQHVTPNLPDGVEWLMMVDDSVVDETEGSW